MGRVAFGVGTAWRFVSLLPALNSIKNNLNFIFMKTKIFIFSVLISMTLFVKCEKDKGVCPTGSETITWDSYGNWDLLSEGYDGYSSEGLNLESDCGWKILGAYSGGVGNIYVIYSQDTAITFVWEWGTLSTIKLKSGWTGSTQDGIKMGDSISKFLEIYSYFEIVDYYPSFFPFDYEEHKEGDSYAEYETEDRSIVARFSPEKGLICIYIAVNYRI